MSKVSSNINTDIFLFISQKKLVFVLLLNPVLKCDIFRLIKQVVIFQMFFSKMGLKRYKQRLDTYALLIRYVYSIHNWNTVFLRAIGLSLN